MCACVCVPTLGRVHAARVRVYTPVRTRIGGCTRRHVHPRAPAARADVREARVRTPALPPGGAYRGRGEAGVGQGQVVRLPAPEELGGEDLAEEGARVADDAHLDVALLQQLVAHAVAVQQRPAARRRAAQPLPVHRRHLPQQRLALLDLPGVAAAAAAQIHRAASPPPHACPRRIRAPPAALRGREAGAPAPADKRRRRSRGSRRRGEEEGEEAAGGAALR